MGLNTARELEVDLPGVDKGEWMAVKLLEGVVGVLDFGCLESVSASTAKTESSCTPNSEAKSNSEEIESKLLEWLGQEVSPAAADSVTAFV